MKIIIVISDVDENWCLSINYPTVSSYTRAVLSYKFIFVEEKVCRWIKLLTCCERIFLKYKKLYWYFTEILELEGTFILSNLYIEESPPYTMYLTTISLSCVSLSNIQKVLCLS